MKKTALLIAAVLLAVSLAACSSGSSTGSQSSSDGDSQSSSQVQAAADAAASLSDDVARVDGDYSVLRIGSSSLSKTMAPNSVDGEYADMIYPTLAKTNVLTGESVGILAKEVSWSDDMLTMYIEMWDNIYDTDGNHITASDAIFCWDKALEDGRTTVRDFDSWVQTGEYTLEMTLPKPPNADGQPAAVLIYSQKAFEESNDGFANSPVSCGPYKLKEFVTDYCIILERNDDFWATDEQRAIVEAAYGGMWDANWDTIEWWQIGESMQMTIALESGTIDYSDSVAAEDLYLFEPGGIHADSYDVFNYIGGITYYLTYNTDEASPLSDVRVRQAVSYAIDTNALVDTVFGGNAQVTREVCGSFLMDYNPAWDEEDNYYNVDLELAQQLLAEAGYPDGLTVIYLSGTDTYSTNIGVVLQAQLRQIGVTVDILTIDNNVSRELKTNDRSSWDINLGQAGSQDYVWNAWQRSYVQGQNAWPGTNGYYVDEYMEQLLDECSSIEGNSPEKLDEFHAYVTERCLAYALCNPYSNAVVKSGVQVVLSPNGKDIYFNSFYYYET